jgi:dihydrofolate reductase
VSKSNYERTINMGNVSFNMSMSLDGFVAGPNDEVDQIFKWYFSGDTEFPFPGSDFVFKVSHASAERLKEARRTVGAMVTGRRNFNLAGAWGGKPPLGVHHFVVTHNVPQEWVKEGSPFTFVTDGVESAIEKAKKTAGDQDVVISSANIMRQALTGGLLDEINIDLVAILLGEGVRLFEHLGIEPIELEIKSVIEGDGVTHLQYAVVR